MTPTIEELRGESEGSSESARSGGRLKVQRPDPLSGPEVIEKIREETDTIFLAFSRGKDSIAAWLKLREYFEPEKIIPFFMWFIPRLKFQEESLKYFEEYFGCRIHRLPHPFFYKMLNTLNGQTPARLEVIDAANFPNHLNFDLIADALANELGFESRPWTASGVRAADSPLRRSSINQYGAINQNRHTFFPVWDMRKAELIDVIQESGCKLPIDYNLWGRSFDGLDLRFLEPLKRYLPEDYKHLLRWKPLAEVHIARRDFAMGEVE